MSWALEEEPAPQPPPSPSEGLARIVLTAALTAAATGLVAWGIEELKERWKPKSTPETGSTSEGPESKTCVGGTCVEGTCVECGKRLEKEGWKKKVDG